MPSRLLTPIAVAAVVGLAGSLSVHAIMLGQMDDFQDGTTQGWWSSAGATNAPTGGPGGPADSYMHITSTGESGWRGELRTSNGDARWAGNYAIVGVTGIEMDLRNLGTSDLQVRILFVTNYGDWTSTDPFPLAPDGQWHHAVFGLSANDLSWGGLGGASANLGNALAHMGGFQIRHQSGPPLGASGGTPIAASMGIDNITAVPEPAVLALAVVGASRNHNRFMYCIRLGKARRGSNRAAATADPSTRRAP